MTVLHIAFKVAGAEYVVPAADVLHLESFDGATPVPGTAGFVTGLVQTRGQVVPVIDLRARFGLPPAERTLDSRVLVVRVGARIAGLLVDSAREVLQIDPAGFHDPPDLLKTQAQGMVQSVAQAARGLVMLINLPRVLGEEQGHDR